MTRFITTLTISAGLIVALPFAPISAQKKTTTDIPVTSIINDYDSGVAPALQIQSDQFGAYTNTSTQASLILASGDWRLDAYNKTGTTRTVYLVFTRPIAGTGPGGGAPVAPPNGLYKVNFGSDCGSNFGTKIQSLLPGQAMPCPMNIHFDYDGKTYDVHMAPRSVNFPESTGVNVTCLFPTSGPGPCTQWRIYPDQTYVAPDGSTQLRSVANLSYETTVRGKLTYVKQGDFYLSFAIIVTNP
jgi:hypothetical protein